MEHDSQVIIIKIFINCNWVINRWQWLFYMYTNMKRLSSRQPDHCANLAIPFPTVLMYEGWNFNSGNYLFTTYTK